MVYCSKCNKEMTYKNGESSETSVIGIYIEVIPQTDNKELLAFWQKQLGKYSICQPCGFCYECWLDSLFGVNR